MSDLPESLAEIQPHHNSHISVIMHYQIARSVKHRNEHYDLSFPPRHLTSSLGLEIKRIYTCFIGETLNKLHYLLCDSKACCQCYADIEYPIDDNMGHKTKETPIKKYCLLERMVVFNKEEL